MHNKRNRLEKHLKLCQRHSVNWVIALGPVPKPSHQCPLLPGPEGEICVVLGTDGTSLETEVTPAAMDLGESPVLLGGLLGYGLRINKKWHFLVKWRSSPLLILVCMFCDAVLLCFEGSAGGSRSSFWGDAGGSEEMSAVVSMGLWAEQKRSEALTCVWNLSAYE